MLSIHSPTGIMQPVPVISQHSCSFLRE